jgi:hypothetical protein
MKTKADFKKNNLLKLTNGLAMKQENYIHKIDVQNLKDLLIVSVSILFFCCVVIESIIS